MMIKQPEPRHILMLTSVYGEHAIGGAERQVAQLAQGLVGLNYRLSIVSLAATSQHQSVIADQLDLYHLPLFQFYDPYHLKPNSTTNTPSRLLKLLWHGLDVHNPIMAARFARLLDRLQPDLVMTHPLQGFSTAVWVEVRSRKIPLVHVLHDHALLCPSTTMTRGDQVCEQLCQRCQRFANLRKRFSLVPDAVIAPSASVLARHRALGWFVDTPAYVIGNALPADWPALTSRHLDDHATAVQPQHAHSIRLGFLGRLNPSKGIDTLYAALQKLREQPLPQRIQVQIAGYDEAGWAAKLCQLSDPETLQISYLGQVRAAEFLAGLDLLIVPSKAAETFCNVVMEAAACAVPSIVSDQGALPERIHAGETGWMFHAGDAEQLFQQIMYCVQHPEMVQQKAQAAWARRVEHHPKQQLTAYDQVIQQQLQRAVP